MRRFLVSALIVASLGVLASCSLFEGRAGLREIWGGADEGASVNTSKVGGVDDAHVYFLRGRNVTAFDRRDGRVVWRSEDLRQVCTAVFVGGGRVYCPGPDLRAFDAATGRTLWTLPSDSSLSLTQGTADATRAFAATLTAVVAADAQTGAVLWRRGFSGRPDDPEPWVQPRIRSLTLSEGDLLVALEGEYDPNAIFSKAVIVALDPATGQERWRYEDGGPTTNRAVGGVTAWDGLLLYTDATGQEVVAVSRATREVVWRRPWEQGFLGGLRAPVVRDGVAYWAAGDSHVYAADARTGAEVWRVKPEIGSYRSHEVCGSVVLANNFALSVVNRLDGSVRGILFDDEQVGQMAVADGMAYVSTERGVYAFDCE